MLTTQDAAVFQIIDINAYVHAVHVYLHGTQRSHAHVF